MSVLYDHSKMPWGKHKHKPLEEVPAKYLLWLDSKMKNKKFPSPDEKGLMKYIEDNRHFLEKEIKDLKG